MTLRDPAASDPTREPDPALAFGENVLNAVLSRAPVLVFALDAAGICTYSEGAGLAKIGLAPGQVVGHDMFEMYADDPTASQNMRRALDGETFRSEYYRPDGPCFDTWWLPTRVDGRITGAIGVSLDVTDRIRTQEQLELFRALVEAAPLFIAIADLDGKVQYVNPGGRALADIPDDVEVVTTSVADYLTPEGRRVNEEIEQPALLLHGRYEGESTLKHWPSGDGIAVRVSSFLLREPRSDAAGALATVQSDITEIVEARRTMERAIAHQRGLLLHLNEAYEAERRRIAAELHDDPVQVLAAVNLRLASLRRQLLPASVEPPVMASVAELDDAVRDASARLRAVLFQLDPPPVLDVGLEALLRQHVDQILEPGTSCDVTTRLQQQPSELLGRVLLRIAREALVNVRKHANARHVTVALEQDEGFFQLYVRDDGRGFVDAEARPAPHLGLRSMAARAEAAGGWLRVTSSPGSGTLVEAALPARLGFPDADAPVPDLRNFLEQTLESIPDAYVALDRDFRYVYMNSAGYALFERDRADSVVGKRIWDEFDVAPEFEQAYRRAQTEQIPLEVRGYYPPWDKWIENSIFPTSSGLSIFARDVTEEILLAKQSEQQVALITTGRDVIAILTDDLDSVTALTQASRRVVVGWGLDALWLRSYPSASNPVDIVVGRRGDGATNRVLPLRVGGRDVGEVRAYGDVSLVDDDILRVFALRFVG